MANELWNQRVLRAQQITAERKGIDISIMLPPRNPSADGSTHRAEAAVAEVVAAPVVADVVAQAEAVVEVVAPVAVAEAAAPAQLLTLPVQKQHQYSSAALHQKVRK